MPLYNFQDRKHGIIRRQFYGAQGAPYINRIVTDSPVGCALRADQLKMVHRHVILWYDSLSHSVTWHMKAIPFFGIDCRKILMTKMQFKKTDQNSIHYANESS
jgi:hypothetical protein